MSETLAEYKRTDGKPRVSLVPSALVEEVARVRTWATTHKYKDPDSWRRVPEADYVDALGRHYFAYPRDPGGVDPESGLSHMAHVACNAAFILGLRDAG